MPKYTIKDHNTKLIWQRQRHPFHMVNRSPWPFFLALAALSTTTGAVLYMHRYQGGGSLLFWGVVFLFIILLFWLHDVIVEATIEGQHTKKVQAGLRFGMKLFIITEIMFFFSFFWAFFHSALAPHTFIGVMWPPRGIIPMYLPLPIPETDNEFLKDLYWQTKLEFVDILPRQQTKLSFEDWLAWDQPTKHYIINRPHWIRLQTCVNAALNDNGYRWVFCYLPLFNPYTIPLAATFILLSSGLTLHIAGMWFRYAWIAMQWPFNPYLRERLTQFHARGMIFIDLWSHRNKTREAISRSITFWLSITIILGFVFTAIQAYEYIVLLPFAINDSIFGSCFYMLTGFHGFHVILGTLGLIICLYRHKKRHFTRTVHVGFECASWYWHFVDGVWLFVYSIIYWWSAPLKRPYLWYNDLENSIDMPFGCGTKANSWDSVTYESPNIPDAYEYERIIVHKDPNAILTEMINEIRAQNMDNKCSRKQCKDTPTNTMDADFHDTVQDPMTMTPDIDTITWYNCELPDDGVEEILEDMLDEIKHMFDPNVFPAYIPPHSEYETINIIWAIVNEYTRVLPPCS